MSLEKILKKYWGYDAFRPLQREIIAAVLENKDTLAVLPTGGGKSICYQIPALMNDGICVVISPLIALMIDQVEHLKEKGIAAAAVHSGMHFKDIDRILDNAVYGSYKFIFLSPERLTTELAIERIKRMKVSLIAVDEAHCISQWGYDFRPPYLRIAEIREHLPDVPILALTATATPEVAKDIADKLQLRVGYQTFVGDFSRPNIGYIVRQTEDKHTKLLEILRKTSGTAIVYVRNRRRTKEIATLLQEKQLSADFYHAGLDFEERLKKQTDWTNNKTKIIVATNAFGMGIDKPDVRTVVHFDMPESLEAYYQEAGRAGRDEKKSYAVVLFQKNDADMLNEKHLANFPPMKEIRRTYEALGSYLQLAVGGGRGVSFDFDLTDFTQRFNFELLPTHAIFKILEQDGWLALTESVYVPSKIKFLVSRETIYDFQLRHKNYERVIKGLLRYAQGITQDYVNVSESRLSGLLQMPVMDIEKIIRHLHQESILEYLPHKEKPQLTFLRDRIVGAHLEIDWNAYMFRKKRAAYQLRKMLDYVELDFCRERQLTEYFLGEQQSPTEINQKSKIKNQKSNCGHCDVCVEKNKNDLSAKDFEIFSKKIFGLLQREKLSTKEILESFSEKNKKNIFSVLEILIDEKKIEKENDKWKIN